MIVTITAIDRADEITIQRTHEDVETLADPEAGDSVTLDVSSGDTITVSATYDGKETIIAEYDV